MHRLLGRSLTVAGLLVGLSGAEPAPPPRLSPLPPIAPVSPPPALPSSVVGPQVPTGSPQPVPPKTLAMPRAATPAPVRSLQSEVDTLAQEREEALKDISSGRNAVAAEREQLRAKLMALLDRLGNQPPVAPSPRPAESKSPSRPKFELGEGTKPIDSLRLAQNLYRDNEIDAALRAFRLIDTTVLSREDRAFVQYMIACCLRRLGQVAEAAVLYREIADAREDEFLAECAVSQLSLIRSSQELEGQLQELRSLGKKR